MMNVNEVSMKLNPIKTIGVLESYNVNLIPHYTLDLY